MAEKTAPEKASFSFKDVVYLMLLSAGFFIQFFTLKQEIHDAVAEQGFYKRETTILISAVSRRVDDLSETFKHHLNSFQNQAIKEKEPKIEREND